MTENLGGGAARRLVRIVAAMLCIWIVSTPAAARADVVLDWNAIAARTAVVPGHSPFHQARLMAITQLAVFEAVNAITGEYESYLTTPIAAAPDASPEAAAIAAAYRVLKGYFPANTAIDTDLANTLATVPDGVAKTNGINVGNAAADAIIELRANDGFSPNAFFVPSTAEAGDWQLTVGCPPAGGQFFQWQDITPFGIERVSDFLLPAPPSVTSSQYAKDYVEVQTVGNRSNPARPADRDPVVRLYAASSPSFALSMVARQIATAQGLSLTQNARAFALIMMGINDSLVASFYNKYYYTLWRPETAIPAGAADGNDKTDGEPSFAPFVGTPCFPSYPSNHASGTNGGLEMMRRLFGPDGHNVSFTNSVPALRSLPATTITREYTELKQIAADVDDARVYGGIHFRFDQDGGNDLGRAVATEIYKNNLRPAH